MLKFEGEFGAQTDWGASFLREEEAIRIRFPLSTPQIAPNYKFSTTVFQEFLSKITYGQMKCDLNLSRMPRKQVLNRFLSAESEIPVKRLKAPQLQNHEWPQLTQAIATVSGVNLHIDDTPGISATEIVARCHRLKSQYGQLGCIVIDYLQLMVGEGGETTRNLELAAISRRFKLMATELDVPVIVLSQLNRNLEQRSNKRPTLSDLRDTSALGQDADVVIGLYRDEIHHSDSQASGEVEVIAIKHRDGELGTVKLLFDGPHVRFRNLAK